MRWHYQVRKTTNIEGGDWFDIVEIYRKPYGHTAGGVRPGGTTKAKAIRDLEHMLTDAKRYRVLVQER